jgi:fatty-acid desaturase
MSLHFYKIIFPQLILVAIATYILVTDFSWMYIVYAILGFYLLGVFGNTIGFHRYFTHQSFEVSKFWHYLFLVLGSMTGQGSVIFWTALHLHHHRNSDTLSDVHSPIHGFWRSSWGWQIKGDFSTQGFIAPRKLYKDKWIRLTHDHYYKIYWSIGVLLALINFYFFLFFFCVGGYFLVSIADNFSNYCFHNNSFGYRTHDTKDNSRNVPIISYIALGAGWHNNHHNNPANYRFGETKSEIDIGAWIIEKIKKIDN